MSDENLHQATDVDDCSPSSLGGLRVLIRTCTEGELAPKSKEELGKEMATYSAIVKARAEGMKATNTIGRVQKIDQKNFTKHGMTHGLR